MTVSGTKNEPIAENITYPLSCEYSQSPGENLLYLKNENLSD